MRERVIGGKMREWESVVRDRSDPPPTHPPHSGDPFDKREKRAKNSKLFTWLSYSTLLYGLYFFIFIPDS